MLERNNCVSICVKRVCCPCVHTYVRTGDYYMFPALFLETLTVIMNMFCTHIRYWFPLIKVWWFYFQFTFHLTHWVYNILYQCLIQLVHYIITCQNLPTFTQCVQITDHIALSVGMFRMFPRGDENCRGSPTFPSCCLVPRDVNFHLDVNFYMIFW